MTHTGAAGLKITKNRDAYLQYHIWAMHKKNSKLWHQGRGLIFLLLWLLLRSHSNKPCRVWNNKDGAICFDLFFTGGEKQQLCRFRASGCCIVIKSWVTQLLRNFSSNSLLSNPKTKHPPTLFSNVSPAASRWCKIQQWFFQTDACSVCGLHQQKYLWHLHVHRWAH